MFRIKTYNQIADAGLASFCSEKYDVSDTHDEPHGIVLRSANLHDETIPSSVLGIARAGAGVNNIPVEQCSEAGIVVFNAPGANANAVKELVIAGVLISSRKIVEGINWVNSLENNDYISDIIEGEKSNFSGPEIFGKTVGVIGLGAIGVLVANSLVDLGMKVKGYDPYISVDSAWGLSYRVERVSSVGELFENCDYITLHIPYCEGTKNLISSEVLMNAKKGIRLLNFSRAELIDSELIINALGKEIVETYVTDFPKEEFLGNPSIICIPHLGASTPESEVNCSVMACRQLKEFLETGNIKNSVNFPDCSIKHTRGDRICITNLNIPSMLGQISSILADNNININEMVNKSKGVYAYTIIDVDECTDGIEEKIYSVEGVISLRVIRMDEDCSCEE